MQILQLLKIALKIWIQSTEAVHTTVLPLLSLTPHPRPFFQQLQVMPWCYLQAGEFRPACGQFVAESYFKRCYVNEL